MGFVVPEPADLVAARICDVRGWWSGQIEGASGAVGDEFTYAFAHFHRSVQRVTACSPSRIEWQVLEGGPRFTADTQEWAGTTIRFDLSRADGGGTAVAFSHIGLTPAIECYEACTPAWAGYMEALQRFI